MNQEENFAAFYFEIEGTPWEYFIPPHQPPWAGLDGLGSRIREKLSPNAALVPGTGGMVERTCVLHDGSAITGGFVIEQWDASKGKLVVVRAGVRLEGAAVVCAGSFLMDFDIEIGAGALIEPGAFVRGPVIIGPSTEVRHGAYIRGDCVTGSGCVIGHATEVKNSIFLDGAKAGHFAYVGDSILGRGVNLGAGTKLANLRIIPGNVRVPFEGVNIDTGRRKLGAILGDGCETGCNSVCSPGAMLGPKSLAYPNATVPPGIHPAKSRIR